MEEGSPPESPVGYATQQQRGAPCDVEYRRQLQLAFKLSWLVNWFLLGAKVFAYVVTKSKAVLASLADSGVDLASQAVIALAEHFMRRHSPRYPVGRARLEAMGVIGCACLMSVAALEVVQLSSVELYNGFPKGDKPRLHLDIAFFCVLGGGTVFKLLLWLYCKRLTGASDSMAALAEDHLNDVASNVGAIAAASIAEYAHAWWVDAVGAILISVWIIWRWVGLTWEQVKKVVGFSAPPEFIAKVEALAGAHHASLLVDCTRAYHYGARYNVEMEIILPGQMTVSESHDIALELQHKIEALHEVERAFVHVDYQERQLPEHKVERALLLDATTRDSKRLERQRQFTSPPAPASPTFSLSPVNGSSMV